ncbi:MAG: hypothetical protein IT288_13055 [Bdellovibrionales bacterium]|nr:hypothetical protein [Bdellovibrionales bacterium]
MSKFIIALTILLLAKPVLAQETAPVKTDVNLQKKSLSLEVDCTVDPKNSKCTNTTSTTLVPGGGLAVQVENKQVTAVTEPPSESYNFGVQLGMVTGAGSGAAADVALLAINFDIGMNALLGFGKKFPGAEGGPWSGMLLAPNFGMMMGVLSFSGGDGEVTGTRYGAILAYEYLNFDPLDPATLEQKGWGIQAGLYMGVQKLATTTRVWAVFNYIESTNTTSESSIGPSIGFVWPKYNAGTAKLTSQEVRLMVLPTGDFTLMMVTGNWSF